MEYEVMECDLDIYGELFSNRVRKVKEELGRTSANKKKIRELSCPFVIKAIDLGYNGNVSEDLPQRLCTYVHRNYRKIVKSVEVCKAKSSPLCKRS